MSESIRSSRSPLDLAALDACDQQFRAAAHKFNSAHAAIRALLAGSVDVEVERRRRSGKGDAQLQAELAGDALRSARAAVVLAAKLMHQAELGLGSQEDFDRFGTLDRQWQERSAHIEKMSERLPEIERQAEDASYRLVIEQSVDHVKVSGARALSLANKAKAAAKTLAEYFAAVERVADDVEVFARQTSNFETRLDRRADTEALVEARARHADAYRDLTEICLALCTPGGQHWQHEAACLPKLDGAEVELGALFVPRRDSSEGFRRAAIGSHLRWNGPHVLERAIERWRAAMRCEAHE